MNSLVLIALLLLFTYFLSVQTIGTGSSFTHRTGPRLTNRNRNVKMVYDSSSEDESTSLSADSSLESGENPYQAIFWECYMSQKNFTSILFSMRNVPFIEYFDKMTESGYFLVCPTRLSGFYILLRMKDLQSVTEDTLKNIYVTKISPGELYPIYAGYIKDKYEFWIPNSTVKSKLPSRVSVPRGRKVTPARTLRN